MIFPRLFDSQDSAIEVHDVCMIIAFILLNGFQAYGVIWGGDRFDARGYGEAVGIILGGGGLASLGMAQLRKHGRKDSGWDR